MITALLTVGLLQPVTGLMPKYAVLLVIGFHILMISGRRPNH